MTRATFGGHVMAMRRILIGLLLLVPCAQAWAQRADSLPPKSDTTTGRAEARSAADGRAIGFPLAVAMELHRVPGVSVALVRGGRLEFAQGYGSASLDPRVPVDTATRFCIGSVTKQFVAVLALILQQDGLLSVHDTLANWYPQLSGARDVTLLDLMNLVAGYHDYYPLDFVTAEMARPTTADSIIARFGTMPLDFQPGTRWSYSNTDYVILGRVLERASGKPLGMLLAQRIFGPLGMTHTSYDPVDSAHRATGYVSWALEPPSPALPEGRGWLGAAGAIWSTPADLARWDVALMGDRLLSPTSRATLFGERLLRDGTPTGYAAGFQVANVGGRVVYEHRGGAAGFVASNVIVPADTAAVIVLENGYQNISGAVPLRLVSAPRSGESQVPESAGSMRPPPPDVHGPGISEVVQRFLDELQHGEPDRSQLGQDYSAFLTPVKVAAAKRSLAPLGSVAKVQVLSRWERGGMEASIVRVSFRSRVATVTMYRTPDGRIQEFMIQ